MKKILTLATGLLLAGCNAFGELPKSQITQVTLDRGNFRVTDSGIRADSFGWKIFGLFGTTASYEEAMNDLRRKAGLRGEDARALVNLTEDRHYNFYFFLSTVTIRLSADVVEFHKEEPPARR